MLKIDNNRSRAILFILPLAAIWVLSLFNEVVFFCALICTPFLISAIFGTYKSIEMDSKGCNIRIFFWKKFYPWYRFKTIRLLNFAEIRMRANPYTEGILFSTRRIKKYPFTVDLDSYLVCTDPFCRTSFYIQFPPKESYEKEELRHQAPEDYAYRVKREKFMACAEKWGLKIEGWNVPMPESQTGKKKKK